LNRKRVLLLVDQLDLGGAERVVVHLATHLDPERFHVAVCTTRARGTLAPRLMEMGVPLVEIGRRSRFDQCG
jgi:hypothetical protein